MSEFRSQIRRLSDSVNSNIVEDYSRNCYKLNLFDF